MEELSSTVKQNADLMSNLKISTGLSLAFGLMLLI